MTREIGYDADNDVLIIDHIPVDAGMFQEIKNDRLYRFELANNVITLTDCGPIRPILVKGKTV